jgi:hypothetical protein
MKYIKTIKDMCLFKRKKEDKKPVAKLCYLDPVGEREFVDLGLSVKWANMNVDAVAPEVIGGYYNYDEAEMMKYNLPTVGEVRELFEKCTMKYDKKRNGFEVKGPNGNVIFVPIGGEKKGNARVVGGYFWTCSGEERGYMQGYMYYGGVMLVNKALKKAKGEVNLLKKDEFWINVREVQR